MDWLDEQVLRWRNKLKRTPLKSTLSIYIVVAIFVVIITYVLTIMFCNSWQTLIYGKYAVMMGNHTPLSVSVTLEKQDEMLLNIIEACRNYSIVLYSILAIIVTSNMFYKHKIQEPISILKEEASHISRNDLSFSCSYYSKDELGEICDSFDKMRLQLIKNNENIWSLMEAQRQLNSAFAHDIRTPLTVMQGYTQMLIKYYPKGKIREEKLLDTLSLMQSQLERLEDFSLRMKDIQDIEMMEIKPSLNEYGHLVTKLQGITEGIKLNKNKHQSNEIDIEITSHITPIRGYFDEDAVLQVVDNLLSNAISFAKSKVEVILEWEEAFLCLYIRDDGNGFSKKELYAVSNAYYSCRRGEDGHLGIGLTICKILCEKHGGKLTLQNSTKGGAILCASFYSNTSA